MRHPLALDGYPLAVGHVRDLIALTPDERRRRVNLLTQVECGSLFYDWSLWARPDQLPPPGDWVTWLILAGRGAGKTRTGAEAVRHWIKAYSPVNLIGATAADARDVMVLGESGLLACCPKAERPTYARSARRLAWPNGNVSLLFSAEEPDRLRGEQHAKLWADELAAWRYPETYDQALLGLRLGDRPQVVVTTTPRPIKIVKDLVADPAVKVTRGVTFDNIDFLATAFIKTIAKRYQGGRLGQQEIYAEILDETPGALWTRDLLERGRLSAVAAPREYREVVVAVDPPATSGAQADECGIIVAGRAENGAIHVLADLSSQGDSPAGWAARVTGAYTRHRANRVVAESNNGGEMVASVLRQCDANLPVRLVTATRGKYVRAEPVAAAYERGLVHHVGLFAKLEDQLCALTPDFDRHAAGFSPDRADALVWAVSDLIGGPSVGMVDYYREQARRG
jgi:phage terminase large subunit-like protein